jgi:hypothetical protein
VVSEPADGIGGISPMLVSSGVAGLGTKIVLRTSRRPRRVPERLGGIACYMYVSIDRVSFGSDAVPLVGC